MSKQNSYAEADALREHFLKSYTRCKRVSKYTNHQCPFKIAEQDKTDKRKWQISLDVRDTQDLPVILVIHGVPTDQNLLMFACKLVKEIVVKNEHATFVFHLQPNDTQIIRDLAAKIRSVLTAKWRWQSNKIAKALDDLADYLDQF